MQWLINIIQEWITAQGYLTTSYVDRGDPAAFDFTVVNFIPNNLWHDLQLPGFVPSTAKLVLIRTVIRATTAQNAFQLRQKGNVNIFNTAALFTQVANIKNAGFMLVVPGPTGLIQYRAVLAVWTSIDLVISGWWF